MKTNAELHDALFSIIASWNAPAPLSAREIYSRMYHNKRLMSAKGLYVGEMRNIPSPESDEGLKRHNAIVRNAIKTYELQFGPRKPRR